MFDFVPMKTITLFTAASDLDDFLVALQTFGYFQPEKELKPQSNSYQELVEKHQRVAKALDVVAKVPIAMKVSGKRNPEILVNNLLEVVAAKNKLEELQVSLKQQKQWFITWGTEINLARIAELNKVGLTVQFGKTTSKNFKKYLANQAGITVQCTKKEILFMHIGVAELKTPDCEFVKIPHIEYQTLQTQLNDLERDIIAAQAKIGEIALWLDEIKQYHTDLTNQLNFFKVKNGAGDIEKTVVFIKGHVPTDKLKQLLNLAQKKHWGYSYHDPLPNEDQPPTQFKPTWASGIMAPFFKALEMTPGYWEMDPSIPYLIFLPLFFGMLIGDALYGTFMLSILGFFSLKGLKIPIIAYLLATSVFVYGVLCGNWGGFSYLANTRVLYALTVPQLAAFQGKLLSDNKDYLMNLSFLIGAIHITFAHLMLAIKYQNLKSIGQFGYIAIIWGMYFVIINKVLDVPFNSHTTILFVGGIVLVIAFKDPKAILSSFGFLPLDILGIFSDILSYIRIYIIGYVSVSLAFNFNQMGLGANNIIFIIIIIVASQILNLVLSLISGLVQGGRLKIVEFSSHGNYEWTGTLYQPFKITKEV